MSKSDAFSIFVVEDDEWYGKMLQHNLELNPDHEVKVFQSGKDFLNNLEKLPDLVTLDFRLPDFDGAELLKRIKSVSEEIEVIIISEQGSIDTAVELLKQGAYDYIVKEKNIRDRLITTVEHVKKNRGLKKQISILQQEIGEKYSFQNSIIGESQPMKQVFQLIEKAIKTNITVSISGETGTGKEVVAKAIHYNSNRKKAPYVPVNMAAIPKDLVESELFGHEKGSFTGAVQRRVGKFEEANKGTLFLDEIAEMDITLQAKLLRALQEKEINRVGSNEAVKVDCRIIVATNKNLLQEVKEGRFREDLYYRLIGLPLELPPLRDREKDIIILAKFFIKEFCKENNLDEKILSNEAQKKLLGYSFPGNVRELKSIVELAVVMANEGEIAGNDIVYSSDDLTADILNEEMTLKDYTNKIIKTYLKKYEQNVKLVAEKLDIGQATIYRMLKAEKE